MKKYTKIGSLYARSLVLLLSVAMLLGLIGYYKEPSERFHEYSSEKDSLYTAKISTVNANKGMTAYDESDSRTYGVAYGNDTIDFEGFYGIRLATSGSKVTYSMYTHSNVCALDGAPYIAEVSRGIMGTWDTTKKVNDLPKTSLDKTSSTDVSKLADGVYAIVQRFVHGSQNFHTNACAWFTVINGVAKCCRINPNGKDETREMLDEWDKFTKDMNPKDYLDGSKLSYPTELKANYHASKELCAQADKLVNDKMSDELKLFAITSWIANTIAYDRWVQSNTKVTSRAYIKKNHNDPSNFAPRNHVGDCWDYTNMLTIMLRHVGIPCTSITNNSMRHEWNAVYINNEWLSIDITSFNSFDCWTEDVDSNNWTALIPLWAEGYCVHKYGLAHDNELWYYKD